MTNTVPEYVAQILEKLSGIGERIAKLEERTDWSKTLVTLIFAAIIGGVAWSGLQQYQLGSLTKASENNAEQLSKVLAALDEQSKALRERGYSEHQVARTAWRTGTRTILQCGVFSQETMIEGRENVFRWPLLFEINPDDVNHVYVGFEDTMPGLAVTGKIVEGGKYCEMEIRARDPGALATLLQAGISGCVSMSVSEPLPSFGGSPGTVYPGPDIVDPGESEPVPATVPSDNGT
jgi:hypothetical protein